VAVGSGVDDGEGVELAIGAGDREGIGVVAAAGGFESLPQPMAAWRMRAAIASRRTLRIPATRYHSSRQETKILD
jgi:hypothetical protein